MHEALDNFPVKELKDELERNGDTMGSIIGATKYHPFRVWTKDFVYYVQESDFLEGEWVESQPRNPPDEKSKEEETTCEECKEKDLIIEHLEEELTELVTYRCYCNKKGSKDMSSMLQECFLFG